MRALVVSILGGVQTITRGGQTNKEKSCMCMASAIEEKKNINKYRKKTVVKKKV